MFESCYSHASQAFPIAGTFYITWINCKASAIVNSAPYFLLEYPQRGTPNDATCNIGQTGIDYTTEGTASSSLTDDDGHLMGDALFMQHTCWLGVIFYVWFRYI